MNKIEQFEQAVRAPRTMLQFAADQFAKPSQAAETLEYWEEFRTRFEALLEALEGPISGDLQSRGINDRIDHDWQLFIGGGRDFLAALGGEIERAK